MPKSDIAGSPGIRIFSFIHTAPFFQNCTCLQSFQQCELIPPHPHSRFPIWCVCLWNWNAKNVRTHPVPTPTSPDAQNWVLERVREWFVEVKNYRETYKQASTQLEMDLFPSVLKSLPVISGITFLKQLFIVFSRSLNTNSAPVPLPRWIKYFWDSGFSSPFPRGRGRHENVCLWMLCLYLFRNPIL